MQLQPHFLFNSLNAIAALVHKDPDAADEMIGALSDFLRLTLESSEEQEVPLRRELEFVERYLAIEKVRFGERLRYRIDAPAETLDIRVPALLLQPIVENSIRHGLAQQVAAGEIEITARKQNGTLFMTIRDNGVGLGAREPKEGVGLGNTKARLRETYGDRASLTIADQNGAVVDIQLPSSSA
jgi:LytS/YehU family sensor histidine kinase